ncbi:hypothetical protein [Krasilnikovia sp. MM14-A1259]|uniref:hypothetical protein n=1 Tax=Krasilnikovia sp. MM14-A1259 TaxID=3373539 RepID=UPI003816F2FE
MYELAEKDYRFGLGALLVKVTNVLAEMVFDNEPWWEVDAIVKAVPNGVGPGQERRLYIRAACLRNARRGGVQGG